MHYLLANLYITCGQPTDVDEKKDPSGTKEQTDEILEEFDDSFDQNDWYIEDPSKKTDEFQKDSTVDEGVSCVSIGLLSGPAEVRNKPDGQLSPSSGVNKLKFIPNCTNLEDCWQAALEHVFKVGF